MPLLLAEVGTDLLIGLLDLPTQDFFHGLWVFIFLQITVKVVNTILIVDRRLWLMMTIPLLMWRQRALHKE